MPFWKKGDALPAPPMAPAPRPVLRGHLPCSERGCPNQDAVACAYVDRRGQICPTAWCPNHQVILDGAVVCRRHARLSASPTDDEFQTEDLRPDVDNRSPSLVDYVANALEPRLVGLLQSLCRPGSNDHVAEERLRWIRPPGGGGRRWERGWKIYDHTGVIVKGAIEADESRDPEVGLRVGLTTGAQAVPPWIDRRRRGLPPLPPDEDAEVRENFYSGLLAAAWPLIEAEVRLANGQGWPPLR